MVILMGIVTIATITIVVLLAFAVGGPGCSRKMSYLDSYVDCIRTSLGSRV